MTLRRRTQVAVALCALVAGAVLAGCAPQAEPTPTPSPRFTSEKQAYAAAEQTYRNYVDALNRVDLSDPSTFEDVYRWATGQALGDDKKNFSRYHAERATVEGQSIIALLKPGSHAADYATIEMDGCPDVSSVMVRDQDGRSLVSPDRVPVQSISIVLERSAHSPTNLLVAALRGRTVGPTC